MDDVLSMWSALLEMTAEVNSRYRLGPDAVDHQREFFNKNKRNFNVYSYVALLDDLPVGFSNGYLILPTPIFDQREIGLIENIFVRKEFRRMGIGSRLVDECYKYFRSRFVSEIFINVVPANELSYKFWTAKGYDVHKLTLAKTI